MSNDLISRNELIKVFEESKKFLQKGLGKDAEAAYMTADSVIRKIKKAPTAYDVDKVVEQLEALSDCADDKIMENEDLEQYYDGFGDGVDEAIKIVKAGGASE